MKKVLAVLLVAGLASSAMAQPSFEGRVGFRADHTLNGTPTVAAPIEITAVGTYNFTVLYGAFNATGFSNGNRGMFNYNGTATLVDPAGSSTMAPRATVALTAPYSFANIIANPNPQTITFDANRGTGEVNNIAWVFGNPAPAQVYNYPPFGSGGAGGAPDTYHPGMRFSVTISDLTARTVTVSLAGGMQAVNGWFVTTEAPPEDGFDGFQNLLPGGFVQGAAAGTLVLEIVPAPGAAALLGLGGLLAARRRRA